MKKYYYMKNGQQVGPFSYDELWNQKISADTLVWYEGMGNWQVASTIPEFGNWFTKQSQANNISQTQQTRPQQRPVQQKPIKRKPAKQKKSYRGIIGISIFLAAIGFIVYLYTQKSTDSSNSSNLKVAVKSKSGSKKSKQQIHRISIPQFSSDETFTKENYPLHPDNLGNEIAMFLGSARTSFKQAKLLYMAPSAEDKFQYLVDTYSENAIKLFLQGPVPVIKYQSHTSALILFYNPWTDLVLLSDWQLTEGKIFIHDLELVTADFLEYDGLNIPEASPLWSRDSEASPIEALSNSMEQRQKLFDQLWEKPSGTGNWREVLYALSSPVQLVSNQAAVAIRLRDHYIGMKYLSKGKDMNVLLKPFSKDMKKLHSKNKLAELLTSAPNTPEIVRENFSLYPSEIWKLASFQVVQKVPEGAFVFVTTPSLTKTFLSFYYKFDSEKELILDRIDWCTFDNEL